MCDDHTHVNTSHVTRHRCEAICEMLRGQELLAEAGLCESE
jgi:hypothetical protein